MLDFCLDPSAWRGDLVGSFAWPFFSASELAAFVARSRLNWSLFMLVERELASSCAGVTLLPVDSPQGAVVTATKVSSFAGGGGVT
jgi:hypothetical protein